MGLLNVGNNSQSKEINQSSVQNDYNSGGNVNELEKGIFLNDEDNKKPSTIVDYLNNPDLFIKPNSNSLGENSLFKINIIDNKLDTPTPKPESHQLKFPDETYTDEDGNTCNVYYNEDGSYQIEKSENKPWMLCLDPKPSSIETYDSDGNLVAKQEGNTVTKYNKDGSVAKTTEYGMFGKETVTVYNDDGSVDTKTVYAANGNIHSTTYNEDGSYTETTYSKTPRSIGHPDETTTKTVKNYDEDGNLISTETIKNVDMEEENNSKRNKAISEILDPASKLLINGGFIDELKVALAEDKTAELDADGDGIITEEELDAYNKKQEKDISGKLDKNGDGKITQDEIDAYNANKKLKDEILKYIQEHSAIEEEPIDTFSDPIILNPTLKPKGNFDPIRGTFSDGVGTFEPENDNTFIDPQYLYKDLEETNTDMLE